MGARLRYVCARPFKNKRRLSGAVNATKMLLGSWTGRVWIAVSCVLAAICIQAVPVPQPIAVSRDDERPHVHTLTWEACWVGTGRTEPGQVTVPLPRHLLNKPNGVRHAPNHLRRPRVVFGDDDRVRIDPATDGKKFPYSAVMRVSTGCSGMLISEKHVLTAAHCVHDGENYLSAALFFLRAGYVQDSGQTKWTFVRRFFVPSQWKNHTERGLHLYSDWDDYDFAVLEMNEGMSSERDVIPPGLSELYCLNHKSLHGAGSKVEYVSFPDDKSRDALWYVETSVETESPHLLYFTGDAWHGSSGAGLYAWDYSSKLGKYERKVVGVLSGNRNTIPFASVQGNFNVAARLTAPNFLLVCHWIGTEETCRESYSEYLDEDHQDALCKS